MELLEPWEQLAMPPQHTLNLLLSPKLPTRQPPSPLPALPSDTIQVGAIPLGPSRTARRHCQQHREPEPHPHGPQGLCLILACSTNQILSRAKLSFPNSGPRDSQQISDVPGHKKEAVMGTASSLFHPRLPLTSLRRAVQGPRAEAKEGALTRRRGDENMFIVPHMFCVW